MGEIPGFRSTLAMNARQPNSLSITERARQDLQRPASHPFRVGETYANRQGKYEVMEIAPPNMTVRYETGGLMMADITILARIWENMQLPPEHAEPGPRQRATGKAVAQPRAPRTVSQFRGLTDSDFSRASVAQPGALAWASFSLPVFPRSPVFPTRPSRSTTVPSSISRVSTTSTASSRSTGRNSCSG